MRTCYSPTGARCMTKRPNAGRRCCWQTRPSLMRASAPGPKSGRGPVGNRKADIGFSLHTVLAMNPQTQEILGCITQEPFLRKLIPAGETKAQRKKRERESQVWEHSVQRIGRVPENCQWIYVGDSGSDVYTFWQTCEDLGYDFVLRVAQDRDVEVPQEEAAERLDEAHPKTLVR